MYSLLCTRQCAIISITFLYTNTLLYIYVHVYRRSLLPTVHKQWPPLMTRLKALRHIFMISYTIHTATATTSTHKQTNATVIPSKLTGKVNLLLSSTTTTSKSMIQKSEAESENSVTQSSSATSFSDLMRPISTTQYSTNKSIRSGGSSSVRESDGVTHDTVDRQQLHLLPPLLVSITSMSL